MTGFTRRRKEPERLARKGQALVKWTGKGVKDMTSEFAIGVHALVYLSHKKDTLSSELLAENICTNPARVRKILSKLKKYGMVETREGLRGGYNLGRNPEDITLRQVSEAIQEEFIKASWKSGSTDMVCLVASGMAGIMDSIYGELNELCLKNLESITIKDIENQIFGNQEAKG